MANYKVVCAKYLLAKNGFIAMETDDKAAAERRAEELRGRGWNGTRVEGPKRQPKTVPKSEE